MKNNRFVLLMSCLIRSLVLVNYSSSG